MARPKRRPDAVPTRDRILAGAIRTFARQGFAKATLAAIGREAGISRPSVLHHFQSKDQLYAEVVEATFGVLTRRLAASLQGPGDLDERVTATATAFEVFLTDNPDYARILVRELLDEGPGTPILLEQVVPLIDMITAFLTTAGADRLRPDLALRPALLQIGANVLLHASAGRVGVALWDGPPRAAALARTLLLNDGGSP